MNLALGPQHHAMLLAMQQQQQGAECDPAALARLQLFGGAGFPAEVRRLLEQQRRHARAPVSLEWAVVQLLQPCFCSPVSKPS